MTSFKTQIELLIDKTIKNITIALFDYEKFSPMTQEQIDEYLAPDRARKHKLLKRSLEEVRANQEHLALLTKMKEKYGDNQPNDDLGGPIQEAFDRALREYGDTKSAEETEPREEVRPDQPDDRTTDGSTEDRAGEGGHPAERDASGGAGEDAGGGGADTEGGDTASTRLEVTNGDPEVAQPVTIRRTGVEK